MSALVLHFQQLQGGISEYKGVMQCKVYDYEEIFVEIMEAPLSEPSFTKSLIILSRPDDFMLNS